MKGFRTIGFNTIMLVVGITGAQITPETANQFLEAFLALWAVGNYILRAITDSPMFKKE